MGVMWYIVFLTITCVYVTGTKTSTPTPTPTSTPTESPTQTSTPTTTATSTNTLSATPTPTGTRTDAPTPTPVPTDSPTPTFIPTHTTTATRSLTPPGTQTPTDTRTPTRSRTHTLSPTVTTLPTHTTTESLTPSISRTPYSGQIAGFYATDPSGNLEASLPFDISFFGAQLNVTADRYQFTSENCSTLADDAGLSLDEGGYYKTTARGARVRCGTVNVCYKPNGLAWQLVGPAPLIGRSGSCLPEWRSFQSKCFRYFDFMVSIEGRRACWPEAEAECQLYGGNLASIGSDAERTFILNTYSSEGFGYWIGGKAPTLNGQPCIPLTFGWSDGSPMDYSFWGYLEPNYVHETCVEIRGGTSFMNNAFCQLARPYLCQTAGPYWRVDSYDLIFGEYGTPITLKFNGHNLGQLDRWLLLDPNLLPVNSTTLLLNETNPYPYTVSSSGTLTSDNTMATVTSHRHQRDLRTLAVYYLLEGACAWQRLPDIVLKAYIGISWIPAYLDDTPHPAPYGWEQFYVCIDGSGLGPSDRYAPTPYNQDCPTDPEAGFSIGNPSNVSLRSGADPNAIVTWRINTWLREGTYKVCFLSSEPGADWVVLINSLTIDGNITILPPPSSVSEFFTDPSRAVGHIPVEFYINGSNLHHDDWLYLTTDPACPDTLILGVVWPSVGYRVDNATSGGLLSVTHDVILPFGNYRVCYLRAGARYWDELGIVPFAPPLVTGYVLSAACVGGDTLTLTVNGSGLYWKDRIALEPFDCTEPHEPMEFLPQIEDERVDIQDITFVFREGTYKVCYEVFGTNAFFDVTFDPIVCAQSPSIATTADFVGVRMTADVPLTVYFNGTGLQDGDRYEILNSTTTSCPYLPYGGTPVIASNSTEWKSSVINEPVGMYRMCYLRAGAAIWDFLPTLCPHNLYFNFTCANAFDYNTTCTNFTLISPTLTHYDLLTINPTGGKAFELEFHGHGLSPGDRVDLVEGACPVTSPSAGQAVSTVSIDGMRATSTITRPYVRLPCETDFTVYTICYYINGAWSNAGTVNVYPSTTCLYRRGSLEVTYEEGDAGYAFCQFLANSVTHQRPDEVPEPTPTPTPNATMTPTPTLTATL